MTTLAYTAADSATMLRRNLRHLLRYPTLTVMVAATPVVLLLIFVYVFGGTLGSALGHGALIGRAAYIVSGIRNLRARRVRATIQVDGKRFFKGKVSCVLTANVGKILGGVEAFPQAQPDDGRLELGGVTARNPIQWARTFGRLALGQPAESPFAQVTQGKQFRIRFDRKVVFELDGGARPASKTLRIKVRPNSVTVCVPARSPA